MKRIKIWLLVSLIFLLTACSEETQKKDSANEGKVEKIEETKPKVDITRDDYQKQSDKEHLPTDETMGAMDFPIFNPVLGPDFNSYYSLLTEETEYTELSTWYSPSDGDQNILLKYIATQIHNPDVLKKFSEKYPELTATKDETAQSFHFVIGDVYYRFIYFIDKGQPLLDENEWKEEIVWWMKELSEGKDQPAAENETETSGRLTPEEAHAEADQKIAEYNSNFQDFDKQYGFSVAQKVEMTGDEYPEIVYLKNWGNKSELQFFRYVAESKFYPENEWISFHMEEVDNPFGDNTLKYFGSIKFKENGTDYPVIGVQSGSGGFLKFRVYGIGEKENAEIVIDRMGEDYSQGEVIIDTKEYKLTVKSNGSVVETITEKDIN